MSKSDLLDTVQGFRDKTKEQIELFRWVKEPDEDFIESVRYSREALARLDSILKKLRK